MLLCNVSNCGDWVLVYLIISLIYVLYFELLIQSRHSSWDRRSAANFLYFHALLFIFCYLKTDFLGNSNSPKSRAKIAWFYHTIGRLMIPVHARSLGYINLYWQQKISNRYVSWKSCKNNNKKWIDKNRGHMYKSRIEKYEETD